MTDMNKTNFSIDSILGEKFAENVTQKSPITVEPNAMLRQTLTAILNSKTPNAQMTTFFQTNEKNSQNSSDEDEKSCRRVRTAFSGYQLLELEQEFISDSYLTRIRRILDRILSNQFSPISTQKLNFKNSLHALLKN